MNIPKEKLPKIIEDLSKLHQEFENDTIEPRHTEKDLIGQFVAVGKLKNPTSHHGKLVNTITIRKGFLRDDFAVVISRDDITFNELIKYRICCDNVIEKWK